MTLGEKLRQLRTKTKRTLQEQSGLLKVSMNTLYRWENDLAVPRKHTMKMLSDYFGVPVDWLLEDSTQLSFLGTMEKEFLDLFNKVSSTTRSRVLAYLEMHLV